MINLFTRCSAVVLAGFAGYGLFIGKNLGIVLFAFFLSLITSYGVFDIKKESAE